MTREICPNCGYDHSVPLEEWQRKQWDEEEEMCAHCRKPVKHKEGTYRHGFWYHSGSCSSKHPY